MCGGKCEKYISTDVGCEVSSVHMVSVLLNSNSPLECCFDTFLVVSLVTVKRTAPYVHAVIIILTFWVIIAIQSLLF